MTDDILTRKKELRRTMLRHLCATFSTHEQSEARSAPLRRLLSPYLSHTSPLLIGLYASQMHEVQLLPLLTEFPQHHYAFPRCHVSSRHMEFYRVRQPTLELHLGSYNIREPHQSCPLLDASQLDMIIIPGVAFSPCGARLGYGGGYYDRYLMRAPQAARVALAYRDQLCEHLPTEDHDLHVEHLICES